MIKQVYALFSHAVCAGTCEITKFFDRNFLHHSSSQSIFITRIAQGGLAEQDGRLRLGDKLILVSKTRVQSNVLSS